MIITAVQKKCGVHPEGQTPRPKQEETDMGEIWVGWKIMSDYAGFCLLHKWRPLKVEIVSYSFGIPS